MPGLEHQHQGAGVAGHHGDEPGDDGRGRGVGQRADLRVGGVVHDGGVPYTNEDVRSNAEPCGSGLAREGGVSVDIDMADRPHSRASPLPQGSCQKGGFCEQA
ncbi:hypothetical protein D3C81_1884150 [compost metagenome]